MEDNTSLVKLDLENVLSNTSRVLFAVNPYRDVSRLYSNENIQRYMGIRIGSLPPHPFAIADHAYRSLVSNRRSLHVMARSESQAMGMVHSLIKAIYNRLFHWLVKGINESACGQSNNESLKPDSAMNHNLRYVGILDIYGFEDLHLNSFEQLCINLANERLQQFFVDKVLNSEQDLYTQEGLKWEHIDVPSSVPVINCITRKTAANEEQPGIFALLDDSSKKMANNMKVTEESFCEAVQKIWYEDVKAQKKTPVLMPPKTMAAAKQREGQIPMKKHGGFQINHYAGPVMYNVKDWFEKNNDRIQPELESLLLNSTHDIVSQFGNTQVSNKKTSSFESIAKKFSDELSDMLVDLDRCQLQFIRCYSPNSKQLPNEFDHPWMSKQMIQSGTVELVKLMQKGYPCRCVFTDLVERYSEVLPKSIREAYRPIDLCEAVLLASGINRADWVIGTSRVFMRSGRFNDLEDLLASDEKLSDDTIRSIILRLAKKRFRAVFNAVKAAMKIRILAKHAAGRKLLVIFERQVLCMVFLKRVMRYRFYKSRGIILNDILTNIIEKPSTHPDRIKSLLQYWWSISEPVVKEPAPQEEEPSPTRWNSFTDIIKGADMPSEDWMPSPISEDVCVDDSREEIPKKPRGKFPVVETNVRFSYKPTDSTEPVEAPVQRRVADLRAQFGGSSNNSFANMSGASSIELGINVRSKQSLSAYPSSSDSLCESGSGRAKWPTGAAARRELGALIDGSVGDASFADSHIYYTGKNSSPLGSTVDSFTVPVKLNSLDRVELLIVFDGHKIWVGVVPPTVPPVSNSNPTYQGGEVEVDGGGWKQLHMPTGHLIRINSGGSTKSSGGEVSGPLSLPSKSEEAFSVPSEQYQRVIQHPTNLLGFATVDAHCNVRFFEISTTINRRQTTGIVRDFGSQSLLIKGPHSPWVPLGPIIESIIFLPMKNSRQSGSAKSSGDSRSSPSSGSLTWHRDPLIVLWRMEDRGADINELHCDAAKASIMSNIENSMDSFQTPSTNVRIGSKLLGVPERLVSNQGATEDEYGLQPFSDVSDSEMSTLGSQYRRQSLQMMNQHARTPLPMGLKKHNTQLVLSVIQTAKGGPLRQAIAVDFLPVPVSASHRIEERKLAASGEFHKRPPFTMFPLRSGMGWLLGGPSMLNVYRLLPRQRNMGSTDPGKQPLTHQIVCCLQGHMNLSDYVEGQIITSVLEVFVGNPKGLAPRALSFGSNCSELPMTKPEPSSGGFRFIAGLHNGSVLQVTMKDWEFHKGNVAEYEIESNAGIAKLIRVEPRDVNLDKPPEASRAEKKLPPTLPRKRAASDAGLGNGGEVRVVFNDGTIVTACVSDMTQVEQIEISLEEEDYEPLNECFNQLGANPLGSKCQDLTIMDWRRGKFVLCAASRKDGNTSVMYFRLPQEINQMLVF
eukprot:GHVL01018938.1.p1 GENE.GHVL01018938.1~~GHVL01018938.1.p1  ORF type:complete len:1413 (+),score=225.29 GHVL01018938.1:81-4319(+)